MDSKSPRLKLLVVEDNLAYQELYEELFGVDFDVSLTKNKEEALSFLRRQVPDIALIDMRLVASERDNTDGLDVAQFIRDLDLETTIIVKSGFPTQSPEIAARLEALEPFATLDKSAENQARRLVEVMSQAAKERNLEHISAYDV